MSHRQGTVGTGLLTILAVVGLLGATGGCASVAEYNRSRREGKVAMSQGNYGAALVFFRAAEKAQPRNADNLHDCGACCVMSAGKNFERGNHAAAMRDLDAAISYYSQAIEVDPSHQASIEGKNIALEQKGEFDEALKFAEWAAKNVGPSARQYIFLASELEERGDVDGALLRYKQAVAMEPKNFDAHVAFAKFLLKHGQDPAAIYHLQNAHKLNPDDGWVYEQLALRNALPAKTAEAKKGP